MPEVSVKHTSKNSQVRKHVNIGKLSTISQNSLSGILEEKLYKGSGSGQSFYSEADFNKHQQNYPQNY